VRTGLLILADPRNHFFGFLTTILNWIITNIIELNFRFDFDFSWIIFFFFLGYILNLLLHHPPLPPPPFGSPFAPLTKLFSLSLSLILKTTKLIIINMMTKMLYFHHPLPTPTPFPPRSSSSRSSTFSSLLTLKSRNQMLWRRVHVEAELFNKVQKTRFTPPSYACASSSSSASCTKSILPFEIQFKINFFFNFPPESPPPSAPAPPQMRWQLSNHHEERNKETKKRKTHFFFLNSISFHYYLIFFFICPFFLVR